MAQSGEDKLLAELARIYAQYGYSKIRTSTFEEYDFYAKYRSFLRSEPIISFSYPDGRLMALKPDVTLSIAKNAARGTMKVYYRENVYRCARGTDELREITQAGLELIGDIDRAAQCEVALLAIKSLRAIGGEFELAVSHMGLISALLDFAGIEGDAATRAVDMISRGCEHELAEIAGGEILVELISIFGRFDENAPKLEKMRVNAAAALAIDELLALREDLAAHGEGGAVRLDFTTINDMDYYNALVFKGYVSGVGRLALSGGRYDGLLEKLGKRGGALGFAVYPDALDASPRDEYDADALIIYDETVTARELAQAGEKYRADGRSAVMLTRIPENGRYREVVYLGKERDNA